MRKTLTPNDDGNNKSVMSDISWGGLLGHRWTQEMILIWRLPTGAWVTLRHHQKATSMSDNSKPVPCSSLTNLQIVLQRVALPLSSPPLPPSLFPRLSFPLSLCISVSLCLPTPAPSVYCLHNLWKGLCESCDFLRSLCNLSFVS